MGSMVRSEPRYSAADAPPSSKDSTSHSEATAVSRCCPMSSIGSPTRFYRRSRLLGVSFLGQGGPGRSGKLTGPVPGGSLEAGRLTCELATWRPGIVPSGWEGASYPGVPPSGTCSSDIVAERSRTSHSLAGMLIQRPPTAGSATGWPHRRVE